ncbi:MAG: hypothetical protein JW889_12085 [Verrucomicrobia bacterium]|nr:hypothetical protein [Verrucomicrobiota bacterium]
MLPRERVVAALEHREPDLIPWGEHFIDYNVYEGILGRDTLVHAKMKETQALWDGRRDEVVESYKRDTIDLVRALDMELICVQSVPPKGYRPEPMEKLDNETYRDASGDLYRVSATTHDLMLYQVNRDAHPDPTIEDLERRIDEVRRQPPDDPDDSRWEYARHAVAELKATHFVALLTDDVQFPIIGTTEEEGWMNLLVQPDLCRRQAEYWGTVALRQIEVAAKLGCDGVVPCGDLGSSTALMASPDIYRDMVYAWHKRYVERAHALGLWVLKHCCGHIWPVIDEIADLYDAYESIQASAGMDIKQLKQRVGDRLCLWGGIWHEHIILGTPDDIRSDVRYAFEYAAPGGGYIMGSSHSLAVDAKRENILEMKRCRDEWGAYPIRPAAWK